METNNDIKDDPVAPHVKTHHDQRIEVIATHELHLHKRKESNNTSKEVVVEVTLTTSIRTSHFCTLVENKPSMCDKNMETPTPPWR